MALLRSPVQTRSGGLNPLVDLGSGPPAGSVGSGMFEPGQVGPSSLSEESVMQNLKCLPFPGEHDLGGEVSRRRDRSQVRKKATAVVKQLAFFRSDENPDWDELAWEIEQAKKLRIEIVSVRFACSRSRALSS